MKPILLGAAIGAVLAASVMTVAFLAGVHPIPAAATVFIAAGLLAIAAANARDD